MSKPRTIATYGLTDEENALVEAVLPADNYQLYNANELKGRDLTDLIVTDATAYIIRAEALDEFGVRLFYTYYGELGVTADETVIWIGTPPACLPQKVFSFFDTFDILAGDLNAVLQAAHKRFEAQREQSTNLSWRVLATLLEQDIENMLRCKYGENPDPVNLERLRAERADIIRKHYEAKSYPQDDC